ncbi:retrotransposon protein, putative, ty3-gypsy subclass [Tanacetum coccineum]
MEIPVSSDEEIEGPMKGSASFCVRITYSPITRIPLPNLIRKEDKERYWYVVEMDEEEEEHLLSRPSYMYLQMILYHSSSKNLQRHLRLRSLHSTERFAAYTTIHHTTTMRLGVILKITYELAIWNLVRPHLAIGFNLFETMTTVDQGMSVEEIERVVAQRVANAIEAIAIYETKTNMARKSMSQTKQQECKVAENANNKRKWEGNHNGKGTVKGGNYKKMGHMTRDCRNPAAARNQRTHTYKKISTLSVRQAENKRKLNNTSKNNPNQQQPKKRQNTGKAYAAGHGEKKYYGGSKPLCPKCNYHHDGPCAPKCHKCNIVGHLVRNCRRPTNDNTTKNQRGTRTSQKVNCYECGNQGHYRRDCPERKNQIGGTEAHGVVHTLRGGETDQDPNNIKDEIKA